MLKCCAHPLITVDGVIRDVQSCDRKCSPHAPPVYKKCFNTKNVSTFFLEVCSGSLQIFFDLLKKFFFAKKKSCKKNFFSRAEMIVGPTVVSLSRLIICCKSALPASQRGHSSDFWGQSKKRGAPFFFWVAMGKICFACGLLSASRSRVFTARRAHKSKVCMSRPAAVRTNRSSTFVGTAQSIATGSVSRHTGCVLARRPSYSLHPRLIAKSRRSAAHPLFPPRQTAHGS